MKYNTHNIEKLRTQAYILGMRPAFRKEALFTDATENYRSPMEAKAGDLVTLRFRTGRSNVDAVFLIHGDERLQMKRSYSTRNFDYYESVITVGSGCYEYYFEIVSGRIRCYYDSLGISMEIRKGYSFRIVPGFSTPDWAKGAVFYQIYVDRFYNGDKSNDVETREYYYIGDVSVRVDDWNKYPAAMGVREFYGGDLQGIIDKLDYLQDLGVDVLYLNPIFVSPSNHKYDTQDYDYVDPHYGVIVEDGGELLAEGDTCNAHATKYKKRVTDRRNLEASNQLLIRLIEEAHNRGMKLILDGVFNHCGSFNKWMDRERIYEGQEGYEKGAYLSAESPYRNFFQFRNENQWPNNASYDGWWSHDTLPKLNYEESRELYEYVLKIAKKWVSPPFCADGWRLDVAADLGHSSEFNHQFWKDFRKAVKEANPEAIILAEHYGNPRSWLKGDEWDTVMNYDAFMEPITWFLTGMEKHSDDYRADLLGNADIFEKAMVAHMANMLTPSLQTAMNELSNHDHSRFLTRTNHRVGRVASLGCEAANENVDKAVLREAVVMQMTWPGAPTIYYGDEAGVCGFTDPDNRRTYPWGREDMELIRFHKDIIALHKKYRVLTSGSLKFLYKTYQGLCYARFSHTERVIVTVNNSGEEMNMEIPVWEAGVPRGAECRLIQVFATTRNGYDTGTYEHISSGGYLNLKLPPVSATIFVHKDEEKTCNLRKSVI